MSLLSLEKLEVAYGGIRAVKGIDLAVEPGELVCLIGANGAGKTTTLRAITGLVRPAAGKVLYDGEELGGRRPHEIARRGLHEPGDRAQRRRLARAVRADEAHELARLDGDIDAFHRTDAAIGHFERLKRQQAHFSLLPGRGSG